jgi:hypothetical protein
MVGLVIFPAGGRLSSEGGGPQTIIFLVSATTSRHSFLAPPHISTISMASPPKTNEATEAVTKKNGRKVDARFHEHWVVQFGLHISSRNVRTLEVISVVCRFCLNKDQSLLCSAEEERKRKRTENSKHFCPPWRSDNFASHLRSQHASEYEAYKVLSLEEKQRYFLHTESDQVVNMLSFLQPQATIQTQVLAKQKCSFFIDSDIVTHGVNRQASLRPRG